MVALAKTEKEMEALMPRWANGEITLKEIKGYSEEELISIARIGYFLLMQGKNEEARVVFEGLVAVEPRNDYYYRALGVIFQKMGDDERAIKQFGYAIHLNPASAQSFINRAEVYIALGKNAEAESDLHKALGQMNNQTQQLSKKAWALYQVILSKKNAD